MKAAPNIKEVTFPFRKAVPRTEAVPPLLNSTTYSSF